MNNYFTGKRVRGLLSILFVGFCLSSVVYAADDYVCEAKQNAKNELAVLTESCPIGQGLWGREPKQDKGFFWIQCGIFPQPLSLEQAKLIYGKISTNVWIKQDGKGFRCLIGPYSHFDKANSELKGVRGLPAYKESFVRWVTEDGQTRKSDTKPEAKQPIPAKPAKPVRTMKEKPAKPVRKLSPAVAPEAPAQPASLPEEKTPAFDGITLRRQTRVAEQQFVVPFLMQGNEQFYMEYGIAWNRLDYTKAESVCSSMGMSMVDEQQWKSLLSSNVMTREKWPLHLPYWGMGKRGLFTSGKVTHLTGTSLLNVVCVK
ncbi:SPOR domain-containing protein [Vibrio albus]|uniref:SPOR domain-containing protein n=1 Tax=Vibrio albus TaxID=2200953 RepID=A0A2U3B855_9VIBR|nr:SPOR domain-containing protein [Vibrio albus]PWI32947.1 SPOR domain-containing protein [Vibrio albus]